MEGALTGERTKLKVRTMRAAAVHCARIYSSALLHFFFFNARTPRALALPRTPAPNTRQAIVRHFHETMTGAMTKGPEIEETTVDSLANILQNSKLQGTKPDYRFPNQNQLNNCWQTMNEFQVCAEQKGKADVACLQKARDYHSVCPAKWIEVRAPPLLPACPAGAAAPWTPPPPTQPAHPHPPSLPLIPLPSCSRRRTGRRLLTRGATSLWGRSSVRFLETRRLAAFFRSHPLTPSTE